MAKGKHAVGGTAKVFMSGRSQAVRLPMAFRFDCESVAIRKVGRHLILSPRFENWDDYFAHSTQPTDDFVEAVLHSQAKESVAKDRVPFEL